MIIARKISIVSGRSKYFTPFVPLIPKLSRIDAIVLFYVSVVPVIGGSNDDVIRVRTQQLELEMELRPHACLRVLVVAAAPVGGDATAWIVDIDEILTRQGSRCHLGTGHHGWTVVTSPVESQKTIGRSDVIHLRTVEFHNRVIIAYVLVSDIDINIARYISTFCGFSRSRSI